MANGPAREGKIQKIRIILKGRDAEQFKPVTRICRDDEDRHIKGCGGTIIRYTTFPNQKGMYFDSEPVLVEMEGPNPDMVAGVGLVAWVYTHNVHWSTCPTRKPAAARSTTDFRQAAAGGE